MSDKTESIRAAQVAAGEAAVIENLRAKGLLDCELIETPAAAQYTYYEGGPSQICHTDHTYKTLQIDFGGAVFDAAEVEQRIADSGEQYVNLHICRVQRKEQQP